jgi:pyridoxine 4-dehydrogenase
MPAAAAGTWKLGDMIVNHIDTAAFYFSPLRSANELINTALAPYPDDLVIATKVGPGRDPSGGWLGPAGPAARPGRGEPAPVRS